MSFTPVKDRIEYGGAVIGFKEIKAIMSVILSQGGRRWTVGPESEAFEKELAKAAGVKYATVVNSGSSGLLLAVAALKLPKGSKVIIPACNFPTAYNAILQNNLLPVVVDVDINTLNLSLDEVKKAIKASPEIKAVIAVNIAGNPVDLLELRNIVGNNRWIILDDCDGFGTTLNGQMVESLADISVASFHAAHIITTGEGGAVFTNHPLLHNSVHKLREWGRASGSDKVTTHGLLPKDYKERYVYDEIGYNLKPLELQCAMGRVQLRRLKSFKDARRKNFGLLRDIFERHQDKFDLVQCIASSDPCWFSFPVLCKIPRAKVMQVFEEANIETRTIFAGNILRHPAYAKTEYIRVNKLTNADRILRDGMFISCHPSLKPEMIEFIGEVIKSL